MKRITGIVAKTAVFAMVACALLVMPQGKAFAAPEPIKIGVVLCITGWAGAIGTQGKEAVTIVTDEINKRGGVLGRPIELFIEDDQSNPTNAAIAVTKLIRDKKVSLVIGSNLTVFCMPMIPILEREQVPNISLGAGHEITVPLKKWVFRIPLTDYRLTPIMMKFTKESLGAKKIALLHSTDSSGVMGAKGVTDNIEKSGLSLVITEKFDPKDTNMIPQLTKIKAANPDAIILYTSAAPAAVIAKNYQQLGMKTPVVANHGVPTPEFVKLAGKIIEDGKWIVYGMKPLYAEHLPADDPYRKALHDPFKKALKEKFGKTDVTSFHANGHDAVNIVAEALKIAKSDDRAALRDALEKVKYKGLLNAEWIYSATDHDGQSGDGVEPLIIRKDGTWWPYKK
jgi:branched-chain amino acid transport system substrate-binding protein